MAASGKAALLSQVSLFAACSKKDLKAIAKAADELTIDDERDLATQGEVGKEAFIIVEGSAAVTRGGRRVATL